MSEGSERQTIGGERMGRLKERKGKEVQLAVRKNGSKGKERKIRKYVTKACWKSVEVRTPPEGKVWKEQGR